MVERVLKHAANAGPAAELAKLQAELGNAWVNVLTQLLVCVGGGAWAMHAYCADNHAHASATLL
jgi:hypothetical protein